MRNLIILLMMLSFYGCAQNSYENFYQSFWDGKTLPSTESLGPDEQPKVLSSADLHRDIQILRAKKYLVLGYSSFNGGYEDTRNAVEQAKKIGASVVLINSKFTNTQTTTSALLVPTSQTTQHSGTISTLGGSGIYTGTSTTYGSTVMPFTISQQRYDQTAFYLAKRKDKFKFGLELFDLSPELRRELERNTGALIEIVIEDSPAFYSNVIAGDVLIDVDGVPVRNSAHAAKLMQGVGDERFSSELTVIRNGEEKLIKVVFRK